MLGNALLASFFGVSHDPADLKKALSAYSKAVRLFTLVSACALALLRVHIDAHATAHALLATD